MDAALDMAREEIVPFIRETWPQWPEKLPKRKYEYIAASPGRTTGDALMIWGSDDGEELPGTAPR